MAGKQKRFGPRLTVSLTGTNYEALSILAEKDEVSVSWVVRRAIEEYLENHRYEGESPLPFRASHKAEKPRP